ncbi:MAG: biotin/lipoyl-binding protein [Gemmatimonadetes bacterium]|nr:biotin/lipoyl-binding protein [Gemmatimonadota bacterium]
MQRIELRPDIEGRVVDILAREGTTVGVGTPLLKIDDAELKAQVARATADRDLARQALERTRLLLAEKAAAPAADLERAPRRRRARPRHFSACWRCGSGGGWCMLRSPAWSGRGWSRWATSSTANRGCSRCRPSRRRGSTLPCRALRRRVEDGRRSPSGWRRCRARRSPRASISSIRSSRCRGARSP